MRRVIGVGMLVAALGVAGCAGSTKTATSPSASAPASSAPGPATSAAPTAGTSPLPSFAGSWVGSYSCAQGPTGLKLTIQAAGANAETAVFQFYPLPNYPAAASGSFAMTGANVGNTITLHQDHWIVQPPGYAMVDLQGALSGGTLSGSVIFTGCTTFTLQRA